MPGAAWVGWAFTVLLGITGSLFFLTLLLFPAGRPPSPPPLRTGYPMCGQPRRTG